MDTGAYDVLVLGTGAAGCAAALRAADAGAQVLLVTKSVATAGVEHRLRAGRHHRPRPAGFPGTAGAGHL